ncbi:LysR substrate-binding domain-containing protein [Vibrio sp. EA2]|uniref:LysR substrate-binding domain-containing protein n=1 Tax=Vibrio sp. EA2 TaxID=3079860 RepID=UPI00294901E1|nr:LysR substrate-binding domain-containing protein [Vibrio sp. EA2]MDV6250682.1 LysR substrate-binding domain-containing protein [Vibrio sp. EA2]
MVMLLLEGIQTNMISDGVTLKKIMIFHEFMKSSSMKGAAENLDISVVSVHKALHSLEEAIECPLFETQGRSLRPLKSAESFYTYSEKLLTELDSAIKDAKDQLGIQSDKLALGSLYSLTYDLVPTVVSGLQNRRPELQVSITQGSNQTLLQRLDKMEIDVALIAQPHASTSSTYTVMPIYQDHMVIAISNASPLAKKSKIALEELTNEKLITLSPGFATYEHCIACFQRDKIKPAIGMQVEDIFTLMNLIQSGVGYSIVPARLKERYQPHVTFVEIDTLHPEPEPQTVSLVCLKTKEREIGILSCIAECRLYALKHKA